MRTPRARVPALHISYYLGADDDKPYGWSALAFSSASLSVNVFYGVAGALLSCTMLNFNIQQFAHMFLSALLGNMVVATALLLFYAKIIVQVAALTDVETMSLYQSKFLKMALPLSATVSPLVDFQTAGPQHFVPVAGIVMFNLQVIFGLGTCSSRLV